jgi:hypothetical protein
MNEWGLIRLGIVLGRWAPVLSCSAHFESAGEEQARIRSEQDQFYCFQPPPSTL